MINIWIGDVGEYLAQQVNDTSAKFICQDNVDTIEHGTYFTSLGDFNNIEDFVRVLNCATSLTYCPPEQWSHKDLKKWTEFYLCFFSSRKPVYGLEHIEKYKNLQSMLALSDVRKTEESQLWVVGCSVSHGVGIETSQRYGALVANKLKKEISFLTRPGSSIIWAADQILRSDIRKDDIVIWGLTTWERFSYYNDEVQHISAADYPGFHNTVPLELITSEHQVYTNLKAIHQVLNFCNKMQAKIIFAGILVHYSELKYVIHLPNFIQFRHASTVKNNSYIDLGTDGCHPGPLTHQWYADEILSIFLKNKLC